MRSADRILGVLRDRGRRGVPLERLYRLLFNRDLYLLAYGRIYRNEGALTPGSTPETADGMTLAKIDRIIEALRFERYRWTPVRRVYVEKRHSTKRRPLGIPTWSDKLLQEVIRLLLEAYYEPQFSAHSHGFRPHRGCHTALGHIYRTWTGTAWFVEGDVTGCFDNINHDTLLTILAEKIHDGRFLHLIACLLRAGYLEAWRYHATLSGSPQGSVVSPILANIYLDRLDRFVETVLLPRYNRGSKRRSNPVYNSVSGRAKYLAKTGRRAEAAVLRKQRRTLPSVDPADPGYRRLHYLRYADDWLLGFCGPRHEAEAIKRELAAFLRTTLKLDLSDAKTLITHARTAPARFLGYDVGTLHGDDLCDPTGRRATNGTVALKVPAEVVRAKCRLYQKRGRPVCRTERILDSEFSIVAQFQQEFRGLVEYYRLAYNLSTQLDRLKYVMERSLTLTLARKLRVRVPAVYARYGTMLETPEGPRKGLRVTVERDGRRPLVAQWGGINLNRRLSTTLDDTPPAVRNARTELVERLLADECELCGARRNVAVHHIRHLKDLRRPGRAAPPAWVQKMAARQRKTLVVCADCHRAIHAGRADGHTVTSRTSTGEPDACKRARPVRRGADGKVPT
jgi:group II intron reverse transcriptase/maturase